ncbi:VOC family protein [Ilumatobacter coccineus]|uniref:Glyoxalase-like domain-containing protein n=1 Tax=Ilumatobacter coccineus (strain NBRC 103263 / KCTC 29153 / YM16-304) TaxID=1313172 RepID=A0A6C7E360_ILUCY|nr:VOC family protein [Ilumatobacter coccineus]BAN01181.1 hypothetical protein YM304_08670 [Ilumatobacter coccineus YM16-304]
MTTQAFTVQVTFDCRDPHPLADWWAETLGWEVEPQDEAFIRSMIEQGHATDDDTTTHRGALVWREGAAIRPPDPAVAGQPRLLFAQVPEEKSTKNRVHLDLRTGLDDAALDALRDSLVERGATIVGGGRQGPHAWITMTDPEGNEFCV